ncbi:LGFP repeat-containing protein [Herpetosiphon giganteus]|uniref:LGFP repeat-containing protein n=1 Tax=Herpetosiphon giganteus TaxID=2029754 RepID=UPI00195727C4|nr:hypothetical protein [Herpetosiphon giganteus]MBM7845655.1 hypothetical protein [Herpetosiphon giganteus]
MQARRWHRICLSFMLFILALSTTPRGLKAQSNQPLPGDGAPTEDIRLSFQRAYERVGGSTHIVEMTNRVHTWGQSEANGVQYLTQNFQEKPEWGGGWGSIIYNPFFGRAFVLHGDIENVYSAAGGPISAWIGYPEDDEGVFTAAEATVYYDFDEGSAYQHFERGFIGWPRGANNFELHTYYPFVPRPVPSNCSWTPTMRDCIWEPLPNNRVQVAILIPFQRAPGYEDEDIEGTDPVQIDFFVQQPDGFLKTYQATPISSNFAIVKVDLALRQTVKYAIEVRNLGHNTMKRGTYPMDFGTNRQSLATLNTQYQLGQPPTRNGMYWNKWDADIIREAENYNLPPALLKAMIAHESAGLGTSNGLNPALAYLYEPYTDWTSQNQLSRPEFQPWVLPGNPPQNNVRPCQSVIGQGPDNLPGFSVPVGTTIYTMLTQSPYKSCTSPYRGLASWESWLNDLQHANITAQYRISASYGLGQVVYRWHYNKFPGPPEQLYDAPFVIKTSARILSDARKANGQEGILTANSIDISAWSSTLNKYNGGGLPEYVPNVTQWYNDGGVASVQPTVALQFIDTFQNMNMPVNTIEEQTDSDTNLSTASNEAQMTGPTIIQSLITDLDDDGIQQIVTLIHTPDAFGRGSVIVSVHESIDATSPVMWTTTLTDNVLGVGQIRIVQISGQQRPFLVLDAPVGLNSVLTRIFQVQGTKLEDLSTNIGIGGFTSNRGLTAVLEDGIVIAITRASFPLRTTNEIYQYDGQGFQLIDVITTIEETSTGADTVPPRTIIQLMGQQGHAGWYRSSVTVSLRGIDAQSSIRETQYRINGGSWQIYTTPFVIDTNGLSNLEVYSVDSSGNQESTKTREIRIDMVMPATTTTISGTLGENGWYITPVSVGITGIDVHSGLDQVRYRLNGSDWKTFTLPFVINLEGITTLDVSAVDIAGNEEVIQQYTVKIDTRRPVVDAWTDQSKYTRIDPFIVRYIAEDPTPGSGIDRVTAETNGIIVNSGAVIDLFWWNLGEYTLNVTATDIAGWEASDTAPYELIATLQSLRATVLRLSTMGEITNQGITNSLIVKIDGAIDAHDRGNNQAAINKLNALINEVSAIQGKKHLSMRAGGILIMDAHYIQSHLP